MKSWHGNTFRINDYLWRWSTGYIPLQRVCNAGLYLFFAVGNKICWKVSRVAGDYRRYGAHGTSLITVTSELARWRLKSPAFRLFAQQFVQVLIKENIKARRHWPLWGGIHRSPVDSPHKGPVTRKMFPFYDASWLYTTNIYDGCYMVLVSASRWREKIWLQIARFMGPTWGPPGSCWTQMSPILAPWT